MARQRSIFVGGTPYGGVPLSDIVAHLSDVGLEPLSSGTWNVFFGPVHLGWLDEQDYRIHDCRGRAQREYHLSPIR